MDPIAIIVAVLIAFPVLAWFGLARIPAYLRVGRQLPSATDEALALRQIYLTNFGARKDAHTFLTLIGADAASLSGSSSSSSLHIPFSAKRDIVDGAYPDSVESFVIGNITRPITKAATKHISNLWDDIKARFSADSDKPAEQVALEQQLRGAFARYLSLKSEHSFDGFMIAVGVCALVVSVFIGFAAYDFIQKSL